MTRDAAMTVQRLYEEFWNKGNFEVASELLAHDLIDHTPLPMQGAGIEGFRQFAAMVAAAFPDLHLTLDDVIVEGNKVVCRWTARGTNTGSLLGLAPSGERISVEGIDIFRLEHGHIAEHWGKLDAIALLQQLGLAPQLQVAHPL